MTFEFSLTEPHTLSTTGPQRSRYTVARLKRLASLAAKLEKAGWPVWLTMTGLAFEPPGVDFGEEDLEEAEELVAELLADLSIYDEFSPFAGKTVDELPDGWAAWMWEF